jgi:hypothetical protein
VVVAAVDVNGAVYLAQQRVDSGDGASAVQLLAADAVAGSRGCSERERLLGDVPGPSVGVDGGGGLVPDVARGAVGRSRAEQGGQVGGGLIRITLAQRCDPAGDAVGVVEPVVRAGGERRTLTGVGRDRGAVLVSGGGPVEDGQIEGGRRRPVLAWRCRRPARR